jgi:hypothetical protein
MAATATATNGKTAGGRALKTWLGRESPKSSRTLKVLQGAEKAGPWREINPERLILKVRLAGESRGFQRLKKFDRQTLIARPGTESSGLQTQKAPRDEESPGLLPKRIKLDFRTLKVLQGTERVGPQKQKVRPDTESPEAQKQKAPLVSPESPADLKTLTVRTISLNDAGKAMFVKRKMCW